MFDTVEIAQSSYAEPDVNRLCVSGGKLWRSKDGHCLKVTVNQDTGSLEPRITVSRNPYKSSWITRAQVSIGSWLNGSNAILPGEADIVPFLKDLSTFVGDATGYKFDAFQGRVTRVDYTRDFLIGEIAVASAIARINQNVKLPRYNWCPVNDTVYYRNRAKKNDKTILIYGKYDQVCNAGGSDEARRYASGKLRLEVSLAGRRVRDLVETMKITYHSAENLLTAKASNHVIDQTMKLMHFDTFLQKEDNSVKKLFELYSTDKALRYVGILYLEQIYSTTIHHLPFINLSTKTLSRYREDILNSGVSPL